MLEKIGGNMRRFSLGIVPVVLLGLLLPLGNGATSGAATKKYTIIFAGATPAGNALTLQEYKFQKLVQASSHGQIVVKTYINSSLGTGAALTAEVNSGAAQMTSLAPSYYVSYATDMNFLNYPFIFSDDANALANLNGAVGKTIAAQSLTDSNVKILAWGSFGFLNFMTKAPVTMPSQMSAYKMRTQVSLVNEATVTTLGAQATPLAASELPTALATGLVNGDVNALAQIISYKDYTSLKYLDIINLAFSPDVLSINNTFFKSLPKNLQRDVTKAALAATAYEVKETNLQNNASVGILQSFGVTVHQGTPSEIAAFKTAEAPLIAQGQAQFPSLYAALK